MVWTVILSRREFVFVQKQPHKYHFARKRILLDVIEKIEGYLIYLHGFPNEINKIPTDNQ